MKNSKLALLMTFFTVTIFAMGEDTSTSSVEIVTDSTGSQNATPDPCLSNLSNTDPDALARCEQTWQAQKDNVGKGQNDTELTTKQIQTTGPSHATELVPETIPTQTVVPTSPILPTYPSTFVPSTVYPPYTSPYYQSVPSETTVLVPEPMPAWEQALQPQTTNTINIQKEVISPTESLTTRPNNTQSPVQYVQPGQSSVPVIVNPNVPVAPVIPTWEQALVPQEGHTITNKETTSTVEGNGSVETVNKQTTVTNQDGNIESDTTTSESVIHPDAPP